jgi:prophage regulatory protein
MSRVQSISPDEVIFLRLPEVKTITGLSKSALYALIREKGFPSPIHIGPRSVAWVRSEVKLWAAERVRTSRLASPPPSTKRRPQSVPGDAWAMTKKWA